MLRAVSATMASASASQSAARSADWWAAIRRRPEAQIRRLCVHAVGLELPDARVGLAPALVDRGDRGLGRPPAVGIEAVVRRRGGEQQQRFAEGVELELLVDPVADHVAAAGVARQGRASAGAGPGRRSMV